MVALVVTIVILVILATVSIYAVLGENGLMQKAEEAKGVYEQAKTNEEAGLGTLEEQIDGYMPKPNATTVAENPAEYYGEVVSNYTIENSDGQTILNDEGIQWKIFHSDGNNIYLIADYYIPFEVCPGSANNSIYQNSTSYRLSMDNVINDYAGSPDITDSRLKALNNDYFTKNYTSTYTNMKAVAYMMDTSANVWGKYANSTYADYAIGGPTLEMFLASYNKKHPEVNNKYQAQATSATGYEISADSGANWNTYIPNSADYLDSTDSLYIISSTLEADYMWLATPAKTTYEDYLMGADYDGNVLIDEYKSSPYGVGGVRPVVCLKSNVQLTRGEDDTYTLNIP